MASRVRTAAALAVLTGALFGVAGLDVVAGGWAGSARTDPGWTLAAAVWIAAALAWAAARSRWRGARLAAALFAVHYGLATALTAVEAVYLESLRPLVAPILIDGAIDAVVAAGVAAALFGGRAVPPSGSDLRTAGPLGLAWRLAAAGLAYAVLFVAAGAGLFLPLAQAIAPGALAAYATDLPAWVVPFQAVRGAAWAALALPLAGSLRGGRGARGLVLGALFAASMGANLLPPNPLLPPGLRLAHLAEVALANAAFGFVVAGLTLRRVAGTRDAPRRRRRSGAAKHA